MVLESGRSQSMAVAPTRLLVRNLFLLCFFNSKWKATDSQVGKRQDTKGGLGFVTTHCHGFKPITLERTHLQEKGMDPLM
jgi:hypothetical protein